MEEKAPKTYKSHPYALWPEENKEKLWKKKQVETSMHSLSRKENTISTHESSQLSESQNNHSQKRSWYAMLPE